jgi:hypothetical protein
VRAGGAQQPGERGPASLPHQLVDRQGEGEFAASEEAVQELWHERMEPVGADPTAGLPEDLGGGHLGAVRAWAAAGPGPGARPRRAAEQPDGRFAVDPGHGHDLIQQLAFLGPSRLPVVLPLHGGVLPKAGSRHGSLLGWIGNRDLLSYSPAPGNRSFESMRTAPKYLLRDRGKNGSSAPFAASAWIISSS